MIGEQISNMIDELKLQYDINSPIESNAVLLNDTMAKELSLYWRKKSRNPFSKASQVFFDPMLAGEYNGLKIILRQEIEEPIIFRMT